MRKNFFFTSCIMLAVVLTSCGPYKEPKYVEVGTNATAFHIPLEQGSKENQKVLKSVDYLEKNKVVAQRVCINQIEISTGRMYWDYKWIPTDTVIVVHRAPVTLEWKDLVAESKESIGFKIPINATASVTEENAARFLYNFGGQSIEWVMDHNVKPFIIDVLTMEFGARDLEACQEYRNIIYDTMKVRTVRYFKEYGLSIVNLGVSGEFSYIDQSIQDAINTKFTSSMKITAAQNEAAAAIKFTQAAEAIKKQKELDADVQVKLALAEAIREGKLTWPSTLVIGKDGNLMDIWGAKNLNTKQ